MEQKRRNTSDLYEWLRLRGHAYSILHAAGVAGDAQIAFDHVDCQYYTAVETTLSKKQFEQLQPYLRWKFDQIEAETKEVEKEVEYTTKAGNKSKKKVKEQVKTGNFVNKFPPTPENIRKKRIELRAEMAESMKEYDEKEIQRVMATTIPRVVDHEHVAELYKNKYGSGGLDTVLRKLAGTL